MKKKQLKTEVDRSEQIIQTELGEQTEGTLKGCSWSMDKIDEFGHVDSQESKKCSQEILVWNKLVSGA